MPSLALLKKPTGTDKFLMEIPQKIHPFQKKFRFLILNLEC